MTKTANTVIFRNFKAKAINTGDNPIQKNIDYILNPNKVDASFFHNLTKDKYAEETTIVPDKFAQQGGRMAFHAVISASGGITSAQLIDGAKEFIAQFYDQKGDYQIVAAVHTNTRHPHVHIVGSTIDILTGKRLQLSKSDLVAQRDIVNDIFAKYGVPLKGKTVGYTITRKKAEPESASTIHPNLATLLEYEANQSYPTWSDPYQGAVYCSVEPSPYQNAGYHPVFATYEEAVYTPVPASTYEEAAYQPVTYQEVARFPIATHTMQDGLSTNAQLCTEAGNYSFKNCNLPASNTFGKNTLLPKPTKIPHEPKCTNCGEKISQKVLDFSLREFSTPLCYNCQELVRAKIINLPDEITKESTNVVVAEPTKPFVSIDDLKTLSQDLTEAIMREIIAENNYYDASKEVLVRHRFMKESD